MKKNILFFISRFNKPYILIIRSAEDYAKKGTFKVSFKRITALFVGIFTLGMILSFFLWRFIYINYYSVRDIEKFEDQNRRLIEVSNKIMELQHQLEIQSKFTNTFKVYLSSSDSLPKEILLNQNQSSK